jgi:hypothetical protein
LLRRPGCGDAATDRATRALTSPFVLARCPLASRAVVHSESAAFARLRAPATFTIAMRAHAVRATFSKPNGYCSITHDRDRSSGFTPPGPGLLAPMFCGAASGYSKTREPQAERRREQAARAGLETAGDQTCPVNGVSPRLVTTVWLIANRLTAAHRSTRTRSSACS